MNLVGGWKNERIKKNEGGVKKWGNRKKFRLYLITVFIFYFQKLVFENIKKRKNSCIFEIKNMFG